MKKYTSFLKIGFINRIDYRQELVMSLLIGLLIFISQAVFWNVVFEGHIEIKGFTYSEILIYYLLIRLISDVVDSKLGFRMVDMIMDGTISNQLLKPFKIQFWLLSEEFGRILVDLTLKVLSFTTLFILVFKNIEFGFQNVYVFFLSLIFAMVIGFELFFIAGCVGFWMDNARSISYSLRRIIMFFSGGLIPLAFFPEVIQQILYYSPFYYLANFPIDILNGDLSLDKMYLGLIAQVAWILICWLLGSIFFSISIKKNESVGI